MWPRGELANFGSDGAQLRTFDLNKIHPHPPQLDIYLSGTFEDRIHRILAVPTSISVNFRVLCGFVAVYPIPYCPLKP